MCLKLLDETPPTGAILCVFIVDMTLHLFEMMYKSVYNRTENGSDEVELSHRLLA